MQQEYYELKIKINPEVFDIVSDICFESFDCDGVVQAEETYDDKILLTTTEGLVKAYIKLSPSPLAGEGGISTQGTSVRNSGEGVKAFIKNNLAEQKKQLILRGFSEEDLGSWDFEISKVENQDWSKKWKENWGVTKVSDRITVVPSWIEYTPKEDEITITLDPGSAFGTGTHPTTQLCMRAIEKHFNTPSPLAGEGEFLGEETSLKNSGEGYKTIADIGMGSGILAICGIKFGAQKAYGCDNDELVIETAIENAKLNNETDKCRFECNTADKLTNHVILNLFQDLNGERLCDPESSSVRRDMELFKFDFVVANIIHNVLAEIMGDLKHIMKDGAKLVLSGILNEKKQVVLDAVKAHNLKLIEETHQDVWVAFVVEK